MHPRDWLAETVRAYRTLSFFQGLEDRGTVTWERPGLGDLEEGFPLPAWGNMSPEQVAERILADWPARWGGQPDPADPLTEEQALLYDVDRVTHWDTECVDPGCDAYVSFLLALARVSRGAFAPERIVERWDEGDDGPAFVEFLHRGEPRRLVLENAGDYLDLGLVAEVNRLLAPAPVRFHVLAPDGQDVTIVALMASERQRLAHERGWRFAEQPELRVA